VEELDAVDGTPVLDIKPWFEESEMLGNYFADPAE
jgi:tRNA (Thr-GGU) A37 N-methylase